MKRTINLLVLVTLLALTFGAAGTTPAYASPCFTNAVNGDFETGDFSSWVIDDTNPSPTIEAAGFTGTYAAHLGSSGPGETPGDSSIYQTMFVPVGESTLGFYYWPRTSDSISFDWQDVYITDTSGTVLATVFHQASNAQTWTYVSYDMSAFAGQTVRIKFLVHGDNAGDPTDMYVDSVSLCASYTRIFGTTGNGSGTSTLVELDRGTGALIGTIGPVGYLVNGLDYDPISGNLYATTSVNDSTFPSGFIRIDMATGAGTPIGAGTGTLTTNVRTGPDGTIYAWTENGDDLVTIDPSTGLASVVGESSMDTAIYGMSFNAAGTLYFVNYDGSIYTINTATGAGSDTGISVGDTAHHGDFSPDTDKYWGIDTNGGGAKNIKVIDIATGVVEQTLPTVNNLHTLAFVIVPSAQKLSLSNSSLNFGGEFPGNISAPRTVTVTNVGLSNLTLGTLGISGDFALTNNTCDSAILAYLSNCTFEVVFQPLSLGYKTGQVSIPSDAASSPDIVDLDGTGVAIPTSGTNLLKKPYFDAANIFPTPWRLFGVRFPYSSVLDCSVYNTAPCSLLFPSGNRSAMQQVNRSGTAGDTYFFGLSSMAQNAGGKYLVEADLYSNFNKLVERTLLYFTPGTHDWETVSGYVTASGNYNKIIFRFYYQNATGRAWFDDAFLMVSP